MNSSESPVSEPAEYAGGRWVVKAVVLMVGLAAVPRSPAVKVWPASGWMQTAQTEYRFEPFQLMLLTLVPPPPGHRSPTSMIL